MHAVIAPIVKQETIVRLRGEGEGRGGGEGEGEGRGREGRRGSGQVSAPVRGHHGGYARGSWIKDWMLVAVDTTAARTPMQTRTCAGRGRVWKGPVAI